MSHSLSGYLHLEIEEIVKETERAFLVRYADGEQEWLLKTQVSNPCHYSVGDHNIVIHLKEGSDDSPA